jgi:hypothetical protein
MKNTSAPDSREESSSGVETQVSDGSPSSQSTETTSSTLFSQDLAQNIKKCIPPEYHYIIKIIAGIISFLMLFFTAFVVIYDHVRNRL